MVAGVVESTPSTSLAQVSAMDSGGSRSSSRVATSSVTALTGSTLPSVGAKSVSTGGALASDARGSSRVGELGSSLTMVTAPEPGPPVTVRVCCSPWLRINGRLGGVKVQAPLGVSAVIVRAPSPALVRVTSTDDSPQTAPSATAVGLTWSSGV